MERANGDKDAAAAQRHDDAQQDVQSQDNRGGNEGQDNEEDGDLVEESTGARASGIQQVDDLDAEFAAGDLQFDAVEGESSPSASDLSSSEGDSWITWYCSLRGHEFFCEVDPDYIDDRFNMYGLPDMKYLNEAMDVIMDLDVDWEDEVDPHGPEREIIDANAEMLYGIIHARFIITSHGLSMMREKYETRDFGECLRIDCERQPLLPIGLSDVLREATVKVFCPRCREIYLPAKERQRGLDGAFWGRTFPHLFLMMYPQRILDEPFDKFVPRVFGFRIHESSAYWKGCSRASGSTETLLDRAKAKAGANQDDEAEADGTDGEIGSHLTAEVAGPGQPKVPANPPEPPSSKGAAATTASNSAAGESKAKDAATE